MNTSIEAIKHMGMICNTLHRVFNDTFPIVIDNEPISNLCTISVSDFKQAREDFETALEKQTEYADIINTYAAKSFDNDTLTMPPDNQLLYDAMTVIDDIDGAILLSEYTDFIEWMRVYVVSIGEYFGEPRVIFDVRGANNYLADKKQVQTQGNGNPLEQVYTDCPRAKKYFERAIENGLITETETGLHWTSTKADFAYFLIRIYDRGGQAGIIPGRLIEHIFNEKNIHSAIDKALQARKKRPHIDELFKD